MWKNPAIIPSIIKKEINKDLSMLCSGKYHNIIPLKEIFDILENNNVIVLQEDNTPWEGLLCGEDAQANINIGAIWSGDGETYFVPCNNSYLVLSWHRMPSGRYEINVYVS